MSNNNNTQQINFAEAIASLGANDDEEDEIELQAQEEQLRQQEELQKQLEKQSSKPSSPELQEAQKSGSNNDKIASPNSNDNDVKPSSPVRAALPPVPPPPSSQNTTTSSTASPKKTTDADSKNDDDDFVIIGPPAPVRTLDSSQLAKSTSNDKNNSTSGGGDNSSKNAASPTASAAASPKKKTTKQRPTYLHQGRRVVINMHEDSCWLFTRENRLRTLCIGAIDHWIYDAALIFVILLSVVLYVVDTPVARQLPGAADFVEWTEIVIQILYTIELIVKVIAMGFALHQYSYARDPLRFVELLVVVFGFAAIPLDGGWKTLRNLKLVRLVHALERLMKYVPELRGVFEAFRSAAGRLRDLSLLYLVLALVMSLLGLQIFSGAFQQRCFLTNNYTNDLSDTKSDFSVLDPRFPNPCTVDPSNGGAVCLPGAVCGKNSSMYTDAFTNLDHIYNAFAFQVFKVTTLVNWQEEVKKLQFTFGAYAVLYALVIVFVCAFGIMNFFVALLSQEYDIASERHFLAQDQSFFEALLFNLHTAKLPDSFFLESFCLGQLRLPVYRNIVNTKWFRNLSAAVTIINILSLAVYAHDLDATGKEALQWINFACGLFFITEAFFRIFAFGPLLYCQSFVNIFDFTLSVLNIVEFALLSEQSLGTLFGAFRALRALSVFRLAIQFERARQLLVTISYATRTAFLMFLLILSYVCVAGIFAVYLFKDSIPSTVRPNFTDLRESILAMFIVLTGENWLTTARNAMVGTDNGLSGLFFVVFYFVGYYLLLNFFLVIVITCYSRAAKQFDHAELNKKIQMALEFDPQAGQEEVDSDDELAASGFVDLSAVGRSSQKKSKAAEGDINNEEAEASTETQQQQSRRNRNSRVQVYEASPEELAGESQQQQDQEQHDGGDDEAAVSSGSGSPTKRTVPPPPSPKRAPMTAEEKARYLALAQGDVVVHNSSENNDDDDGGGDASPSAAATDVEATNASDGNKKQQQEQTAGEGGESEQQPVAAAAAATTTVTVTAEAEPDLRNSFAKTVKITEPAAAAATTANATTAAAAAAASTTSSSWWGSVSTFMAKIDTAARAAATAVKTAVNTAGSSLSSSLAANKSTANLNATTAATGGRVAGSTVKLDSGSTVLGMPTGAGDNNNSKNNKKNSSSDDDDEEDDDEESDDDDDEQGGQQEGENQQANRTTRKTALASGGRDEEDRFTVSVANFASFGTHFGDDSFLASTLGGFGRGGGDGTSLATLSTTDATSTITTTTTTTTINNTINMNNVGEDTLKQILASNPNLGKMLEDQAALQLQLEDPRFADAIRKRKALARRKQRQQELVDAQYMMQRAAGIWHKVARFVGIEYSRTRNPERIVRTGDCEPLCSWWCDGECACRLRYHVAAMIYHPLFDILSFLVVLDSLIALGFNSDFVVDSTPDPERTRFILFVNNIVVTAWFCLEVALKIFVLSPRKFVREPWNVYDFVVAALTLASNFVGWLSFVRSLWVVRVVQKWHPQKMVLSSLATALPEIVNVIVLLVVTLFTFSLLGVHLFAGSFAYCTDSNVTRREDCNGTFTVELNWLPQDVNASNLSALIAELPRKRVEQRQWRHTFFNYNNVGEGFVSSFLLFWSDGWSTLLFQGMDSNGDVDAAMQVGWRPEAVIFFVAFIFIGNFVMKNLFVSTLLATFSTQRLRDLGYVDRRNNRRLLTPEQEQWVRNYRFARDTDIVPPPPAPEFFLRRWCCSLYFQDYERGQVRPEFEMSIVAAIFINVAFMASEFADQPSWWTTTLFAENLVFVCIFAVEFIITIIAVTPQRFLRDPWHGFSMFLVATGYLDVFLESTAGNVFRVVRGLRLLRVIRRTKGLYRFFEAIVYAMPQIVNVTVTLFLVLYVFGTTATALFQKLHVNEARVDRVFTRFYNFRHAGNSMIALLQAVTTAGWGTTMKEIYELSPENSGCTYEADSCGSWAAIPFFVIFMLCAQSVFLNLYIFVMVDTFIESDRLHDVTTQWLFAQLRDFSHLWARADPESNKVVPWDTFVRVMERFAASERQSAKALRLEVGQPTRMLRGRSGELIVEPLIDAQSSDKHSEEALEREMRAFYEDDGRDSGDEREEVTRERELTREQRKIAFSVFAAFGAIDLEGTVAGAGASGVLTKEMEEKQLEYEQRRRDRILFRRIRAMAIPVIPTPLGGVVSFHDCVFGFTRCHAGEAAKTLSKRARLFVQKVRGFSSEQHNSFKVHHAMAAATLLRCLRAAVARRKKREEDEEAEEEAEQQKQQGGEVKQEDGKDNDDAGDDKEKSKTLAAEKSTGSMLESTLGSARRRPPPPARLPDADDIISSSHSLQRSAPTALAAPPVPTAPSSSSSFAGAAAAAAPAAVPNSNSSSVVASPFSPAEPNNSSQSPKKTVPPPPPSATPAAATDDGGQKKSMWGRLGGMIATGAFKVAAAVVGNKNDNKPEELNSVSLKTFSSLQASNKSPPSGSVSGTFREMNRELVCLRTAAPDDDDADVKPSGLWIRCGTGGWVRVVSPGRVFALPVASNSNEFPLRWRNVSTTTSVVLFPVPGGKIAAVGEMKPDTTLVGTGRLFLGDSCVYVELQQQQQQNKVYAAVGDSWDAQWLVPELDPADAASKLPVEWRVLDPKTELLPADSIVASSSSEAAAAAAASAAAPAPPAANKEEQPAQPQQTQQSQQALRARSSVKVASDAITGAAEADVFVVIYEDTKDHQLLASVIAGDAEFAAWDGAVVRWPVNKARLDSTEDQQQQQQSQQSPSISVLMSRVGTGAPSPPPFVSQQPLVVTKIGVLRQNINSSNVGKRAKAAYSAVIDGEENSTKKDGDLNREFCEQFGAAVVQRVVAQWMSAPGQKLDLSDLFRKL